MNFIYLDLKKNTVKSNSNNIINIGEAWINICLSKRWVLELQEFGIELFIGIAIFFKKFLLSLKVHQHLEPDDRQTKMTGGFLTVVFKKSVASPIPSYFL